MRYPTMSGLGVDAAGVSGAQVAQAASAPEESKNPMPKPALKPPTVVQEYGNQPPSLKNVSFVGEPKTYQDKLEKTYPAAKNATD